MADDNKPTTRDREISWLFPELLTNDGIIDFLKQRYVDVPEASQCDREKLLELYYKHAMPLPQRKYRLNLRGREMSRRQILQAKKRKISGHDASDTTVKSLPVADNTPLPRFMTSANISASKQTEPLKSLIDFNRKVIKLNSSKEKAATEGIKLGEAPSKDISRISPEKNTSQVSSQSTCIGGTSGRLKRPVTSEKTCLSPEESQDEKEVVKPKIQRISWP